MNAERFVDPGGRGAGNGGDGAGAVELSAAEGRFGRGLRPSETFAAAPRRGRCTSRCRAPVECWAKVGSKDDDTPLVAYEPKSSIEHWELFTARSTGGLTLAMTGYSPGSVPSSVDLVDGKWHYLAMAFDGTTVRLFVDAKMVAEKPVRRLGGWSDRAHSRSATPTRMAPAHDLLLDEVRISRGARPIERLPDAPSRPTPTRSGSGILTKTSRATGFADASPNHNKAQRATGTKDSFGVSPSSTRWEQEDHGPFFSSSLTSPKPFSNNVNKGVSVRLGRRSQGRPLLRYGADAGECGVDGRVRQNLRRPRWPRPAS